MASGIRTIRVGPNEFEALEKISKELHLKNPESAGRMGVCVLAALSNAQGSGFAMQMVDAYSRRWEYSLRWPKKIFRLDKNGRRTGEEKVLVPDMTKDNPQPPRPRKLKAITGGKG